MTDEKDETGEKDEDKGSAETAVNYTTYEYGGIKWCEFMVMEHLTTVIWNYLAPIGVEANSRKIPVTCLYTCITFNKCQY